MYTLIFLWASRARYAFLTNETDFVLFLAVLANPVLPMGWNSSHTTLKVTPEIIISEVTSLCTITESTEWRSEKGRYVTKMSNIKEMTNDE